MSGRKPVVTPSLIAAIKGMREMGKENKQISKALGVSYTTVSVLIRLGYDYGAWKNYSRGSFGKLKSRKQEKPVMVVATTTSGTPVKTLPEQYEVNKGNAEMLGLLRIITVLISAILFVVVASVLGLV